MRIEVRNDKVTIDGYVNAVERDSRELITEHGRCVEQVKAGAFADALKRADDVLVLLNHNQDRKLASTKDGTAKLYEDNIGLRAIVTITDAEVAQKARDKQLRGWSFGFVVGDDSVEQRDGQVPRRVVRSLELHEVSIIDNTMVPAYIGTSIESRAEGDLTRETRGGEFEDVTVLEEHSDHYRELEQRLSKLNKGD